MIINNIVPIELTGQRIDKILSYLFKQFSRTYLQNLIKQGKVQIDGKVTFSKKQILQYGSIINLKQESTNFTKTLCQPESINFNVIYKDNMILIVDKPAGLVVHPGKGNESGTLMNALIYHYSHLTKIPRAGIVHRLDKNTSGLMIIAQTLDAQNYLINQLRIRTVKRQYFGIVWGKTPLNGVIDAPIGRDYRNRLRMAVVYSNSSKPARTYFNTIASGTWNGYPVTALCYNLYTGRTHQIRVHSCHIGHPIIGDLVYSRGTPKIKLPSISRQALHAWHLKFQDPLTNKSMYYSSPLPQDIIDLSNTCGLSIYN